MNILSVLSLFVASAAFAQWYSQFPSNTGYIVHRGSYHFPRKDKVHVEKDKHVPVHPIADQGLADSNYSNERKYNSMDNHNDENHYENPNHRMNSILESSKQHSWKPEYTVVRKSDTKNCDEGFYLYDTKSNEIMDLEKIYDGHYLDLTNHPTIVWEPCNDFIRSVKFFINGHAVRIENIKPYTISGDNPDKVDFQSWDEAHLLKHKDTYHLIEAFGFTEDDAQGKIIDKRSVSVMIHDSSDHSRSSTLHLDMHSHDEKKTIRPIMDGDLLSTNDIGNYFIRAWKDDDHINSIKSIQYKLDGKSIKIISRQPFNLAGKYLHDYLQKHHLEKDNEVALSATMYDRKDARGDVIDAKTFHLKKDTR